MHNRFGETYSIDFDEKFIESFVKVTEDSIDGSCVHQKRIYKVYFLDNLYSLSLRSKTNVTNAVAIFIP